MSGLEEEARKRKERLLAMKRKATEGENEENQQLPPTTSTQQVEAKKLKKPVFRSYNPLDDELAKLGEQKKAAPEAVENQVVDQLQATKDETVIEEVDLTTLAPRKIDWDLKRDIQKRLDKLERKTQRCIAELIRERLAAGKTDLVSAVNSSSQAAAEGHASDEDD